MPTRQNDNSESWVTSDFKPLTQILILNSLGFFFLDFLVPYVSSQELGASGWDLGFMYSLHTFGFIASSAIAGAIADKMSKKILVFVGSFGRGIAYFILYGAIIAKSLPFVTFGFFSLGFLVGIFWVPYNALLADKSDKNHRSFAFGKKTQATGIGQLIGGILGLATFAIVGVFLPENSILMYVALPVYGVCNIIAGFMFQKRIDESLHFAPLAEIVIKPLEQSPIVKHNRDFRAFRLALALLIITLFVASMNKAISKPFVQVYLLNTLTTDPFLVALTYIPAGIGTLLLAESFGRLADKIDLRVGIAVLSTMGAIMTWVLINSNTLWQFAVILLFDESIAITSDLIVQNVFSRISRRHRGRIQGIQGFFSNLGFATGPLIGGWAWDQFGRQSPFLISIYVELAIIPFFIWALKAMKPHFSEKLDKDLEENV